jgi:hypothetical protein
MSLFGSIQVATKNEAWFSTNATLVLEQGRIICLLGSNPMKFKIGDGTTQLQNLLFLTELSTKIVTPAGNNQATATVLNEDDNIIDSTDGVKGVALSSNDVNYRRKVRNADAANDLFVYPKVGGEIYYNGTGLGANNPLTISPGNAFEFVIYELNKVRAFNP